MGFTVLEHAVGLAGWVVERRRGACVVRQSVYVAALRIHGQSARVNFIRSSSPVNAPCPKPTLSLFIVHYAHVTQKYATNTKCIRSNWNEESKADKSAYRQSIYKQL